MERREVLEAAYNKLEGDEPDAPEVHDEPQAPVEGEAPDTPQDKAVEGAKGHAEDGDDKSEPPKQKEVKEDKSYQRAAEAAAGQQPDSGATKPPVSWKTGSKAQWEKLPLDVKQEVLRREKEISQYISQNDHHKRFSDSFSKVVQPYSHLIQSQGSTPLRAVQNLMATAAGLATGNAQQKAAIVAEIISNYAIDVNMLDRVLSGSVQTNGGQLPQQAQVPPAMLEALKPVYGFMDRMNQMQQAHEERKRSAATAEVEKAEALPYFEDLREDMADILELAAKRGIDLTIEQAHEKAVALNPEIASQISKEKRIQEARVTGTRLAKARRAASTIVGAPSGAPGGAQAPKTRREALEAAWSEADSN
jgi:hypothetical protein